MKFINLLQGKDTIRSPKNSNNQYSNIKHQLHMRARLLDLTDLRDLLSRMHFSSPVEV